MKYISIILFIVLFAISACAQQNFCTSYEISFIPSNPTNSWDNCPSQLVIDTISNPDNVWQIGTPSKPVFDSAYSASKAILTDTLFPYPPNDTSYFTIYNGVAGGGIILQSSYILSLHYKVNTDSLNDYGTIEFSPDNGTQWIDLLNDTVYDSYYHWSNKPVLTGNSNGWQYSRCHLSSLGSVINFDFGDTTQFRFTFISDSVSDGLDGIMFDDFYFLDEVESVEEFQRIASNAFPNPTNQLLTIEFENSDYSNFNLTLTDGLGKLVYSEVLNQPKIHLATDKFPEGIYFYSLTNLEKSERAWGKFVVQKD